MKNIIKNLLIIIVVLTFFFSLTSCSKDKVVDIRPLKDPYVYSIEDARLSVFKVLIIFESGKEQTVFAEKKSFSVNDLNKLNDVGLHQISFYYEGVSKVINVSVVEKITNENDDLIKEKFIVTYIDKDSVNENIQKEYLEGTLIENIVLEKDGYNFLGWYINDKLVTPYDFSKPIEKNISLHAKWESVLEVQYTITFILDNTLLDTISVSKGEKIILIDAPVIEKHTFSGWYLDDEYNTIVDPLMVVRRDITLYGYNQKQSVYYNGEFIFDSKTKLSTKFSEGTNLSAISMLDICKQINLDSTDYNFEEIVYWTSDLETYSIPFPIIINADFKLYPVLRTIDHEFIYVIENDNIKIIKANSNKNNLIIPSEIKGYKVTSIASKAFDMKETLKQIYISDSIKVFGNDIFNGCNNLQAIYTSDNNVTNLKENLKNYILLINTYSHVDEGILSYIPNNNASSLEDAIKYFDYIVFNRIEECIININFPHDNTIASTIINSCTIENGFSVSITTNSTSSNIKMKLTYQSEATLSSTKNYINTQIASVEAIDDDFISQRDNSFDEFKINNIIKTYNVTTSEQLYYVLEHGYKPTFTNLESSAYLIYQKAKAVLREIINDSDSDFEKIHKIYDYLIYSITYDSDLFALSVNNPGLSNLGSYKGFALEGVFNEKRAVCDGISKALVVLARIEGIEAIRVSGLSLNQGNNHAWNKVLINGIWYNVDATSGGALITGHKEVMIHNFLLISDNEMFKNFKQTNYLNIVSDFDFNIYENNYFTYKNNLYDYNITSQEELNIIIAYLENVFMNMQVKFALSIDFKLAFDYGNTFNDELNIAFGKTSILTYSQIVNDNIITIYFV